jgi:phage shock protein A
MPWTGKGDGDMLISAKTIIELVRQQEQMKSAFELQIRQLNERIETLEKRPILVESKTDEEKSSKTMETLFLEMTEGVKDDKAGRVIYTDGRQ